MVLSLKHWALIGVAVILFSIGTYIMIAKASPPLSQADMWSENPICGDDILICKPIPFSFTHQVNGKSLGEIRAKAEFESRGIFAIGHEIKYEIRLITSNFTSLEGVHFLFVDKNQDFNFVKGMKYEDFLKNPRLQKVTKMQEIYKNEFYVKNSWIPDSESSFMLVIFFADENGVNFVTNDMFHTASHEQKAIDVTSIETRITNKTLLGLTWVGIALALMFVASDIVIRIVLKSD